MTTALGLCAGALTTISFLPQVLRAIRTGSSSDLSWTWLIAANSHVVKAALEWSNLASVALVILQFLAEQLVLLGLFPVSST